MPPFFLLTNIATTSLNPLSQLTGPKKSMQAPSTMLWLVTLGYVPHAAQVLYGNLNAEIDGSDYLGDAAKYIKLYNQLQAELSSGAHS